MTPTEADDLRGLLDAGLDRVQHWVEPRHHRGHEPFDGLPPWFRPRPGIERGSSRLPTPERPPASPRTPGTSTRQL